jgi:hypothetical protein
VDTDEYAVINSEPQGYNNDEYDPNQPWNERAEQNKRDPFSLKDLEVGTKEWERRQKEHWTFGNAQDLGDAMQYGEEGIYQLGGYGSMPLPQPSARGKMGGQGIGKGSGHRFVPGSGTRYTLGGGKAQPGLKYSKYTYTGSGPNRTGLTSGRRGMSERLMIGADISGKIRHGDVSPGESFDDGGLQFTQRKLAGLDMVSNILKGRDLQGMPGAGQTSKQRPENVFTGAVKGFGGIGDAVGKFFALTEFEKESDRVRSQHGIKIIEDDRYYTVMYHPDTNTTYIEWKPTEDIRNISKRTGDVGREWSEDFIASLGIRIPAWSRRVKYIKDKYGMESDNVKHYGYSRGGGIATHMGGVGYGTGYFSSYLPHKTSKSKYSGDKVHDYIINPLSYALMLKNITKS